MKRGKFEAESFPPLPTILRKIPRLSGQKQEFWCGIHFAVGQSGGTQREPVGLEIGELVLRVQPLHYGFPLCQINVAHLNVDDPF